jgi:arylsulfatase A-like enzyme
MPDFSRRNFLGQLAGTALAASLPATAFSQTTRPAAKKPNVLFFMSDDMRVEIGCYNSMFHAQTPHLDALAKSGVRFDRNYCQFPICNPSRASLFTGKRPTITKVLGNGTNLRNVQPDIITLPQLFRMNGYVSARAGKIFHGGFDDPKAWDVGGGVRDGDGGAGGHTIDIPRTPVPQPGSDILPPLPQDNTQAAHSDRIILLEGKGEGHPDYKTADLAIQYLNKYKDQPFFIGCGFVKPHSPMAAPQSCYDLYDLDKIELTPDFAAWPTVPQGFPSAAIRKRNADLFIGRGASKEEAKQYIRAYIAAISFADQQLGRVVAELDKLGLRENTVMVFVADHGYQLGEKGKWSKAGSLFEMGTRVPLIIVDPGANGNGTACFHTVQSLDIFPTMMQLCNLQLPAGTPDLGLEGTSLTPLLQKPDAPWDQPAYSVWSEDGRTLHGTAIRTADWRYAEFGPNGSNGAMLFDPKKDPLEMHNLANDPQYADVVKQLSPLVRQYAASLKA